MPPVPLPPSLASAYRGTAQTPLLGPSAARPSEWTQHRHGLPTGASMGDPWEGHCRIIGTSKMNGDPNSHTGVDVEPLQTAIGDSQEEWTNSERGPTMIFAWVFFKPHMSMKADLYKMSTGKTITFRREPADRGNMVRMEIRLCSHCG